MHTNAAHTDEIRFALSVDTLLFFVSSPIIADCLLRYVPSRWQETTFDCKSRIFFFAKMVKNLRSRRMSRETKS